MAKAPPDEIDVAEAPREAKVDGVSEALMHNLDVGLEQALVYLRAMTLSIRAHYKIQLDWVPAFGRFTAAIFHGTVVFKEFLLPLTITALVRIRHFFDEYLEMDLGMFIRKINNFSAEAVEHLRLAECISRWYAILGEQCASWDAPSDEVFRALNIDAYKLRKDVRVLHLRSKVVDDIFVALLFIPEHVGRIAAPFVHGGAERDFRKPNAARTPEEAAIAATMVMTDTFRPAAMRMSGICEDIAACLRIFSTAVDELMPYCANIEEDPTARDKVGEHHALVTHEAFKVLRRCADLTAMESTLKSDVEGMPFDKESWVAQWVLQDTRFESGRLIVDVGMHATSDIGVISCLDVE
mmetsp:Transcript_117580/g.262904  ORF Transcript_117580/g.262904 Transcript_117580/m.262904 type:complete len:353 (+) Transcript_117580:158-1216(+)